MFHQLLYHHHRSLPPTALLFPAVDPYHRYLIHSTVQDHFPALTSVSVGEGEQRRTAVSFRSAPSPPDSPLIAREEREKQQTKSHHEVNRRECMQSTAHPPSQEKLQGQHSSDRQDQQQDSYHSSGRSSEQHQEEGKESQPSTHRQQEKQNCQRTHKQEDKQSHHSTRKQHQEQQQEKERQQSDNRQQNHQQQEDKQRYHSTNKQQHHHSNNRQQEKQTHPNTHKQQQRQHHNPHKQEHQQQHNTHKHNHSHSQNNTDNPQSKTRQEPVTQAQENTTNTHTRGEKQHRREERPQQTQSHTRPPRFRSQSNSGSHSRQRQWASVSPHRTPQENNAEESHSKRRRNRKNRRQKERLENTQQNGVEHVKTREKQTKENKESGQGRRIQDTQGGRGRSEGCATRNNIGNQEHENLPTEEEYDRLWCGGGSSSLPPSPPRPSPEGMSVTMPPETINRRRAGKAPAQIYRPPPARGGPEEASPSRHCPALPRSGLQEPLGYHTFPVVGRQRNDSECSTATNASDYYGRSRGRRPDQVLYVPRGRRNGPPNTTGSARATPTPLQDIDPLPRPPSPTYSVCSVASEYNSRNRYGRRGSQASLLDGEETKVRGRPPQAKGEAGVGGQRQHKAGPSGRFSSETYQLIERCLNHDADAARSKDRPSPQDYSKGRNGRKSPAPPRDAQHSIHSKENIMAPQAESGRRPKKRRSRRRHSRSREPSTENLHGRVGEQPTRANTLSGPGGEWRAGSCERIFYNSGYERYDRGYDNYDRYSSSRASSRNPSVERPAHTSGQSWRAGGTCGSNPVTPRKSNSPYCPPPMRGSPGKPPSGRLGSLPNVAFDSGENNTNHSPEHCHTLPVHLPSTRREEPVPPTLSGLTLHTPPKHTHNTQRRSLDNSMTCSWTESVPMHDHTDNKSSGHLSDQISNHSLGHSQDFKSSSKESLTSTRSPSASYDSSPCSSPSRSVDAITQEAQHTNNSTTDHAETQVDRREDTETNSNQDASVHSTPTEQCDLSQSRTESPETPRESLRPAATEERNEKKASKKFEFNWADQVEDSWDSLYDDSGECLDSDLKQQLNDTLGKVKLEKPVNDYCRFQVRSEAEMNEDDYAHVIEIYDFPTSFKTQDLLMVFGQYLCNGFDVKWVDDTHALGIFSTALMASEALALKHPFLKTRSLAAATKSSRSKAMRITDALLPYKPRPATSAALARRLVSGALGLKVNISREVREAEKQKLKDAKARKRLEAKQKLDAWEGNLT